MPFSSKAQMRYLFAKEPKLAREFAESTPDSTELPDRVNTRTGGTNRQHANMLNERGVSGKKKKKSAWGKLKFKDESGGY